MSRTCFSQSPGLVTNGWVGDVKARSWGKRSSVHCDSFGPAARTHSEMSGPGAAARGRGLGWGPSVLLFFSFFVYTSVHVEAGG